MNLNESDIKKIIRKVISEGSYNNLRRRGVMKITDISVLGSVIEDIIYELESNGYELTYNEGSEIPDVVRPYLDDIVDAINFEDLQSKIWDLIVDHTYNSDRILEVVEKIKENIDQNS
jgi:hypothetical protein